MDMIKCKCKRCLIAFEYERTRGRAKSFCIPCAAYVKKKGSYIKIKDRVGAVPESIVIVNELTDAQVDSMLGIRAKRREETPPVQIIRKPITDLASKLVILLSKINQVIEQIDEESSLCEADIKHLQALNLSKLR